MVLMLVTWCLLINSFLQIQCDKTLAPNSGIENVVSNGQEREVKRGCRVRLPHKAGPRCKRLRTQELAAQKRIFQLDIRAGLSMPLVNMTAHQLVGHFLVDPFAAKETGLYINMLRTNKASSQHWLDEHPEEITEFAGYEDMFTAYRSFLGDKGNPFYRFASNKEPFQSLFKDWRDDQMFTEQRLSGVNPMVLRRVTNNTVGLKWSELQPTLNPNFDWDAAVQRAMDSNQTLEEAVKDGHVYALRYEVFDDMITTPDIMDDRPGRRMWQTKSPVALFTVEKNKNFQLRPAAIQIDYKPDSPVFTPDDGGAWTLAKMVVQATDYSHSQIIEHLLKVHLLVEPFCVALQRHLSSQHPLNVILKYHCRGVMVTNTIGSPTLITPGQYMDKLTPMGYKGTLLLLQRGYKTLSWQDSDFHLNIKKRGVGDKRSLPYYPYRDDGELLLNIIKEMAKDYVHRYYKKRRDVRRDSELQAFVNELSEDGTGPDGGRGQIKDFPAKLKTKKEVADIVARLIWLTSVQHAALNYPVGDYGAFTPVLPTKIYNDSRVPTGTFAIFNLPNVNVSTAQAEVAMNIGTFHYDTLFDYYKEMPDPLSFRMLKSYYFYLKYAIHAQLRSRNVRRYSKGHLTYPYLQYPWLPNGIQT